MLTLTLNTGAPPGAVLSALRAHAGEWRASHIPDALRRARVIAVDTKLDGVTCTVSYRRSWYGPADRALDIRARATVMPAPRGATVQLVGYYSVRAPLLVAIGCLFVMAAAAVSSPIPVWLLVGLVGCFYALPFVVARSFNRRLSRAHDPEADYLIRRLEEAVAVAGSVAPSAASADEV